MTLENFINVSIFVAIDLVIVYVAYLVMGFLRMRKQKNDFAPLHEQLKVGQNVMLVSGIHGKIKTLSDDSATLEIADKVVIKVSRFAIHSINEV